MIVRRWRSTNGLLLGAWGTGELVGAMADLVDGNVIGGLQGCGVGLAVSQLAGVVVMAVSRFGTTAARGRLLQLKNSAKLC